MFNLAVRLLFSRKKWLIIMVFSIAIMLSSCISMFIASAAIKEGIKEKAYNLYGEHSGILFAVSDTKENLEKEGAIAGEFRIKGTTVINKDKVATVGWMDKEALNLGHLKLLQGEFPKRGNEVAIEYAYLQLIDHDWKIGQTRKIRINNIDVTVMLVGVVQNYSAQWTIPIDFIKGKNDLPNIFISNQQLDPSSSSNYLIKFEEKMDQAIQKTENLVYEYNQRGVLNEHLYDKGLKDYQSVSSLTLTFQCLTLLLSLFCIKTFFYHFNINQNKKMAVLKSVGAKRGTLTILYFYEYLIVFLLSLFFSIPLLVINYFLIVNNSFENSQFILNYRDVTTLTIELVIIFIAILISSMSVVKKTNKLSVNELFRINNETTKFSSHITRTIHSFPGKQLARQLSNYPKQLTFTILIISISILVMTFSIFFQKETAGSWDKAEEYYLTAQEGYGFDTINNLNVLVHQGQTFSVDEVKELEKTPGVTYIESSPFMIDVHPLISQEVMTPAIREWINTYGPNTLYKDKKILPNIRYKIVDSKEFKEIHPTGDYSDFIGKVMLFIPTTQVSDQEKEIIGKEISFVRSFEKSEGLKTVENNMKVYDVINKPFTRKISEYQQIRYDEITIILDMQTANKSGLFQGYSELGIYIDSDLSSEDYNNIDEKVYHLIASIPGSLIQNIPDLIKEDNAIYSFISILGIFTFIIAIVLAVISIGIIVFSNYRIQKRTWGIYLSLGMNKKQLVKYLTLEMLFYLVMSSIISLSIFTITFNNIHHIYSYWFYFKYVCFAILLILVLLLVCSSIVYIVIEKQPISSFLRRED
ncbi:ABC transporter permease [Niallia circulans]|uniref:ABC transporter permease n=1 Tax=Niallia circulans TaxID=1397 RepID=UPI0026EBB0E1|nr:ABC transporter permease [Niallia circulans]